MARKRALVVGLGIAGIASAIRLHGLGWDVVVIERASGRRQGGQFLALFGTGIAAAKRLGFADAIPNRIGENAPFYGVNRKGERRAAPRIPTFAIMPKMLVRGDIEDAAFTALSEDVDVRYSCTPTALREDDAGVEVDILNRATETTTSERFDLVVGADGLRSTVRRLIFRPEETPIHRLEYMIATFSLDGPVPGFEPAASLNLSEPGRSARVFGFANRPGTVLFSYRTDDVDRELAKRPIDALRDAYGPEDCGPVLGWLLDECEKAPDFVFDSTEQVRAKHWSRGRVVLIGDAAWCLSLYSGMGASSSLAGADLLGTMLQRYPEDLPGALRAWEGHLRPFIAYHTQTGIQQRSIFTAADRKEWFIQSVLFRLAGFPKIAKLLPSPLGGKDAIMKSMDIAEVSV